MTTILVKIVATWWLLKKSFFRSQFKFLGMGQTKRIFIIEDDQMISSMYKTKLEAEGFAVQVIENGFEGLKAIQQEAPDLVLLDIMLPQLDGFSVLRQLRSDPKTKNIPVIIITNLGTEEDISKGKKAGATDYLVKANFTPAQVAEKVKKYLK